MIDSERMTAELHRGLAGVCEERPALRLATVATMVRLAGEVCIDKTHTVVRVELRDPEAAFQLRRQISEISPRPVDSEIITTSGCSLRYLVRVTARGSDLARVLGLIDRRGVAVLGLPPSVIAGGPALAPGVWRGALLARGRIVGSQSLPRLHVTCPTAPVALALVGAARPFGVTAVAQDTAVGHRAVVNQPAAVDTLLRSIGVPSVADAVRQAVAAARPAPTGNPAFQSVNALRATAAAEATAARTRWALNVLGDQAPEHLQAIGRMRVEYPTLSLPELGRLSNPPLSKNAVSGRLRRLCRQAEESAGTSAREPSTPAV